MTRRWPHPWVLGAVLAGVLLRLAPMWLWPAPECVRDECVYRYLATGVMQDGVLGVSTKGWLAAPGYPYLLAWLHQLTGSWQPIKWIQIAVSIASIPGLAAVTARVGPSAGLDDRHTARAARIAAWGLALHPTLAWFSNHQWIETFYVGFLIAVAWLLLKAWERASWGWAAAAGGVLGVCILFRGVATWLPPLFALALVWPGADGWRVALRTHGRSAAALVLGAALVVTPYSVFATRQYGGFMISDATMGHVLYLGNNDFPPLTFDYGNGALTQPLYYRTIRKGRRMCRNDDAPVLADRCDVRNAMAWAADHPGEFVARVPTRLAQQLNPHSFLTRDVRQGGFEGLPWQLEELLVLWVAGTSALIVLGGTLGGLARGRGPFAVLSGGTIVYTLASAAVSYGLSRFRLPLEPLWLVWLAVLLADPRGTLDALRAAPLRAGAAAVAVVLLGWGMSVFALTGYPMFWR